jgi:hypothetical protein
MRTKDLIEKRKRRERKHMRSQKNNTVKQQVVETSVKEFSRLSITFKQVIKNKQTETINSIADVQIVAVNKEGKLYRTLPECLIKFAKETMEE